MIIQFNIEPQAKPRMTRRDKWWQTDENARKCVVDYYEFKTKLNSLVKKKGFTIGDKLSISFYLSMPKSWSMKKREEMKNMPHQQSPDLDNLVKGFTDSLLQEDCHLWQIQADKFWTDEGYIEVGL